MRVSGIVPLILNEAKRRDSDTHGLRVDWNEQGVDIQRADAVAAITEAVKHRLRLGELVRKLHRSFLTLGVKRAHIAGIPIKRGEGQRQVVHFVNSRSGVVQQKKRIEIREPGAQTDGLAETPKVETAHVKQDARAEPRGTGRRLQAIAPADPPDLRAETSRKRILFGLVHLVENEFLLGFSFRILNGGVDPREDAQVV